MANAIKPTSRAITSLSPAIPDPSNVKDIDRRLKQIIQNIIENLTRVGGESNTTSKIVEILTGGSGLSGDIPTIAPENLFIQVADPGPKTYPYYWVSLGASPPATISLLVVTP